MGDETCATCQRFGFVEPGTCAYGGDTLAERPACERWFPKWSRVSGKAEAKPQPFTWAACSEPLYGKEKP